MPQARTRLSDYVICDRPCRGASFTAWSALVLSALWGGAALAQDNGAARGPIAKIQQPTHDFGDVAANQRLSHAFTITNVGDEPLKILKVRPSCGCTVAHQHPKQIAPGLSGEFPFQLSTKRMKGRFSKAITVETNDPHHRSLRLVLAGTVHELIEVSPSFVQFGRVEPDSELTKKVIITNKLDAPLELSLDEVNASEVFKGTLAEVIPGQQYELTVTASPPYKPNLNRYTMQLDTNAPKQPTVEVICMATMPSRLELQPPRIRIPTGLVRTQRRVVVMTNNGEDPVHVLSAKCDDENVAVRTRAIEAGRRYQVIIEIPADYEVPESGASVALETDDAKQPHLAIPLQSIQPIAARVRRVRPEMKLVGQPAPRMEVTTFDGGTAKVGALSQQPQLIVFYASWCGFSKQAIPGFERLYRRYADKGVDVLAVNCDEPTGKLARTREQSIEHYHKMALSMPMTLDPTGKIREKFRVSSFPTAVLVGERGIIEAVHTGSPSTLERAIAAELDVLLAGKGNEDFPESPALDFPREAAAASPATSSDGNGDHDADPPLQQPVPKNADAQEASASRHPH